MTPVIYFIAIGILMFIPVTGGIYPAYFLSSLKPGNLFSIDLKSAGRGLIIRRALILVQFVIAIFLTIQSAAIFKQYLFMKNKDLGIDMENIIQFEIPDYLSDKSDAIREALLDHNDIKSVSYIQQPLGNIRNTNTLTSPKNQERVPFKWIITDPEQFEVLRLKLLSGRTFTRNREADKSVSWIINETGARAMGFNPAEKITNYMWKAFGGEQEFEVIGVVKDYHFNSVNKAIEPLILRWSDGGNMAVFRYETDDLSTVLNHLEKTWNQFEQNRPINYSFLDETFDKYYITEQRLGTLVTTFTLIALIIACFGVFGISAFMAQQMSRSISLRRVMGGETGALVIKFTSEYFWLICVAGVVSIPLAYLYIGKWLSRFPYKTDISAWIFILGFLLNLLVVLLTVAYNAFRTVRKNPAEVLRYE
ncbi:MAG: FtsX-like permease family protein [Bacteroidales bacterium]|nr:FtsX-like permease family protein [Bacteroidales bacterium]